MYFSKLEKQQIMKEAGYLRIEKVLHLLKLKLMLLSKHCAIM
jgi:hypothetical protein